MKELPAGYENCQHSNEMGQQFFEVGVEIVSSSSDGDGRNVGVVRYMNDHIHTRVGTLYIDR